MSKTVVVIARTDVQLRVDGASVASAVDADVSELTRALSDLGLQLRPVFGASEERLIARSAAAGGPADRAPEAALETFYEVEVPDAKAEAIARQLAALPEVAGAYVSPDPMPAQAEIAEPEARAKKRVEGRAEARARMEDEQGGPPRAEPAPAVTPNFVPRQGYRAAAPEGIDVAYAWSRAGGRGAGIGVIDCEGAWRFTHEDLIQNQGGVIGPQTTDLDWRNHGTAVTGVIGADDNGFGALGIAPDARVRGSSIFGPGGVADAIRSAADALQPGDVVLIEVQFNFLPVERWPAEYAAIRYASNKGVIVVEAAANGGSDLDDARFDAPEPGFPADWVNPFRRGARDSGAIVVGAGAPPPGTHGQDYGPDRSRIPASNFGSMVDAQGWGREVTTCGYGDLQGGGNEDFWYTDDFRNTSAASPQIVGALACVQGALRAAGRPLLTPATARSLLRTTGSPQQAAPGRPVSQRIGARPDLRQMIDRLLSTPIRAVALYRYWNPTIHDHFYTTNWSELGGGAHGWRYEGIQCYILPSRAAGSVPLYRYWNPLGDHFYTTNWSELGGGGYGYRYEGIQGYVQPAPLADTVRLYRYWNGATGDHFYTTNWSELGGGAGGYGYEGIQCHVFTQPVLRADASRSDEPEGVAAGYNAPEMAAGAFASEPDFALAEGAAVVTPFAEKSAAVARRADAPGPVEEGGRPSTDWGAVGTAGLSHSGVSITINLGKGQAE